jgi:hypothetical protein
MNSTQNGIANDVAVPTPAPEPTPFGTVSEPSAPVGKKPFVPRSDKKDGLIPKNLGGLLAGAGFAVVLVLFVLGKIPHAVTPTQTSLPSNSQQTPKSGSPAPSPGTANHLPVTDTGGGHAQEQEKNQVQPEDVQRTAKQHPTQSAGSNLGSVAPFDKQQPWEPPNYQPGAQPGATEQTSPLTESRNERDALDKPSLVFVRNAPAATSAAKADVGNLSIEMGIDLPPGTRLRARLESAVNTAVRTPVVAVVEYNYEQSGEIVVPAGSKIFGHLDAADSSGLVGVRFDSMLLPDGASVGIEAAATDLQLRPLRGKVEGRNRGRNILVRSASGIGEIAATLVGRGSINQPLSEGDLLRERVSNNIGQTSDQELKKLAGTEHLVISMPANTEIYVVLEKPASAQSSLKPELSAATPPSSQRQTVEQLRQLLQLQKELNQEVTPSTNQNQ